MGYQVRVKKKELRKLDKLPKPVQKKFKALVDDLETKGPIQDKWPNYSKLGDGKYHCHLTYSYVACWSYEGNELIIEVYYVGSREKAPY